MGSRLAFEVIEHIHQWWLGLEQHRQIRPELAFLLTSRCSCESIRSQGVTEKMDPVLLTKLLGSIASDNLVVFCGAGLSMAKPSELPSARAVANNVAAKYCSVTAAVLPANADSDLEVLASFALSRGELRKLMLQKLVEWYKFTRKPNAGHFAVADFLGARIVEFAISTNFDTLIEVAAEDLGEPLFEAALDGKEASRASPHHPLLKIHGCCRRNKEETLWCREQLLTPPLKDRIESSKIWLNAQLRGRDVLFIGFWTDWDYLNSVIEDCIRSSEPALVVLVDPLDSSALQCKAPELWNWANSGRFQFHHERISGADFLDELRKEFSILFLEQLLAEARPTFCALTGSSSSPPFSFDRTKTSADFYSLRRDYTGISSTNIVREKIPSALCAQVGAMHLRLISKGAVLEIPRFVLSGKRIRLVQGAGQVLSLVKNRFAEESAPPIADEVVICAGAADDGGVPAHLVRGAASPSIVRSSGLSAKWLTSEMAVAELGI